MKIVFPQHDAMFDFITLKAAATELKPAAAEARRSRGEQSSSEIRCHSAAAMW